MPNYNYIDEIFPEYYFIGPWYKRHEIGTFLINHSPKGTAKMLGLLSR